MRGAYLGYGGGRGRRRGSAAEREDGGMGGEGWGQGPQVSSTLSLGTNTVFKPLWFEDMVPFHS